MKSSIPSSMTGLLALMAALSSAAYAQSSPSSDIRESNDPDRALQVERKAEAISGRGVESSGKSGEEATDDRQQSTPSDEFYGSKKERSPADSGEAEGSSGQEHDVMPSSPAPESSGGSGAEGAEESGSSGGGAYQEGEMRESSPPDASDPYY